MTLNYFMRCRYNIKRQDLFYDNGDVFLVNEVKPFRSFSGERVYDKINAVPKKFDGKYFKENFIRLTGGKG